MGTNIFHSAMEIVKGNSRAQRGWIFIEEIYFTKIEIRLLTF